MATPYPPLIMVLALTAAALMGADGGRGQDAWQTMTGSEQSFTVDFPAAPDHAATLLKTGAGAPYTMHQYLVDEGERAYVVQTAAYPAEVDLATPRANLKGGLDNAAKSMQGGRWTSIDWLTYEGHPAVNAIGVRDGKAIRSFSVLNGRRIVTLTYAGPMGSAQSPDADRFIGSLRLDPTP